MVIAGQTCNRTNVTGDSPGRIVAELHLLQHPFPKFFFFMTIILKIHFNNNLVSEKLLRYPKEILPTKEVLFNLFIPA